MKGFCFICKKLKGEVKGITTYNGSVTSACLPCAEDMKWTLRIMGLSADWYLTHRNKPRRLAKSKNTVLIPVF